MYAEINKVTEKYDWSTFAWTPENDPVNMSSVDKLVGQLTSLN